MFFPAFPSFAYSCLANALPFLPILHRLIFLHKLCLHAPNDLSFQVLKCLSLPYLLCDKSVLPQGEFPPEKPSLKV